MCSPSWCFLVKIESRLTLFYLANDVIQHSKRRNYEFVDSWGTTLQKATTLVREDKVKEKISRIFNIWEQREIYSEDFIADLHGLLAINSAKKSSSSTSITPASSVRSLSPIVVVNQQRNDDFEEEFQLSAVVTGIRNCVSLESETDKNLKIVMKAQVPDIEKTRNNLKGENRKLT
jgi:CID domain